jgi:NAD/NADP transhydrogenase alpha subunit
MNVVLAGANAISGQNTAAAIESTGTGVVALSAAAVDNFHGPLGAGVQTRT